jgi:hypothetical protein
MAIFILAFTVSSLAFSLAHLHCYDTQLFLAVQSLLLFFINFL